MPLEDTFVSGFVALDVAAIVPRDPVAQRQGSQRCRSVCHRK
jgi:hypothetical protein